MSCKNIFHFLFVLIMTCPVMGQVKKQLTEDDYNLWSKMEPKQFSEKGNWISYSLQYGTGTDTLFVKNTTTLKTYSFAGGTFGEFATEHSFVFRGANDDLVLCNLKTGNERRYPNIKKYSVIMRGQQLIMLKNAGSDTGDLIVVGIDGTELIKLPMVSLYSLNPEKNKLACDSERRLHLLDLTKKGAVHQVDTTERNYTSLVWQPNGASIAWITDDKLARVGQYQISEKKLYMFDCRNFDNFPINDLINTLLFTDLTISDDGERLLFGINGKYPAVGPTGIEIWNTADKMLYDHRAVFQDWKTMPKLAVWFPEEQKLRMITNNKHPFHILIPGQKYALVYNLLDNEPQFDGDAPVNYYLKNIITGQQQLLLKNHSPDIDKIVISNTGRYIAYFKNQQWWVYDMISGIHRDLTSKINVTFTEDQYDRSGEEKVSGIAGWTGDDIELLIYDNYDLWLVKTDGSIAKQLTMGRKQGIVYRVVSKSLYGATGSVANGVLNVNDGFLLQAFNNEKSGYFSWSAKKGLRRIVFENNRIGWLKQASSELYCYIRENYHLSPQLVFKSGNNKPKVLYQSNEQQNKYNWGFSKLIHYENSKNQPLNGALFYPAGYDAGKSYPMIVHIYERLSDLYNQYVNPSLYNTDGFNITNFTTMGYFVLLPDIAYEEGQTGNSALDCVVHAVDEVLAHETVDPTRIGIYGHSFGGYQTNFIVTQTNKFAAAISGAGISDVVSSYLTVGKGNKKSDGWRYEFNQFRIGTSLFDGYQKYVENSPITFANQVTTPLLLWCGKEDSSINHAQSLEFHIALRRLQKPNIFLLYENGGHVIIQKEDQIDLTHRMQEWCDFYLKNGALPDWFTPDKL